MGLAEECGCLASQVLSKFWQSAIFRYSHYLPFAYQFRHISTNGLVSPDPFCRRLKMRERNAEVSRCSRSINAFSSKVSLRINTLRCPLLRPPTCISIAYRFLSQIECHLPCRTSAPTHHHRHHHAMIFDDSSARRRVPTNAPQRSWFEWRHWVALMRSCSHYS